MSKKISFLIQLCDHVTRYSIFALVFLMPIFFLPWTSDVLDFNKQALLVVVSFVGIFTWMVKVLVSGTLDVRMHRVDVAATLVFLAFLASTIFSVFRYGSIWGWPNSSSQSLLSFIGFFIVYFLVSNTFSKKDFFISIILLGGSVLLVQILGLLQLIGWYVLPFEWAKSIAFNTVGTIGSLVMLLAVLLPVFIIALMLSLRWLKVLFGINLFLTLVIFVLTSYRFTWWMVLTSCALIMVVGIIKRTLFPGRWMFLPMFFLIIALFFIVLHPQFKFVPQIPTEFYVSPQAGLSIGAQALKHFPLLGSGPGTFGYDFAQYKDKSFNETSLWNINFNIASSKVLTDVPTLGLIGIIAFIGFIGYVLVYATKYLVWDKVEEDDLDQMPWVLALSAALIAQILGYFFYNSNVTLDFIFFFLVASLVALVIPFKRSLSLEPSSLPTLTTTFIFTLLFIFGLGFLLLGGQRYVADVQYVKAIEQFKNGDNSKALASLERAASLNSSLDLYFNQLSQAYLDQAKLELANNDISQEVKTEKVQALVTDALNASKIATDLNPKNANNWAQRARIYASLIGVVTDADSWALKSYDEAIGLDPNNPYLPLQQGIIYYQKKEYKSAQAKLEKALSLKSNYVDALYFAGLTYDSLDQSSKAKDSFSKILPLVPKDQAQLVQNILDNLNAGKPALEGLDGSNPITTPPPSPTTPSPEQ